MTDDMSPEYRLARAREREHIVAGLDRGQSEWRSVLEVLERSGSVDDAQGQLQAELGFSREQASAVMDMQFRRITRGDRTRIADELAALRAEIEGLGGES